MSLFHSSGFFLVRFEKIALNTLNQWYFNFLHVFKAFSTKLSRGKSRRSIACLVFSCKFDQPCIWEYNQHRYITKNIYLLLSHCASWLFATFFKNKHTKNGEIFGQLLSKQQRSWQPADLLQNSLAILVCDLSILYIKR